jgi:hypothetical protein
VVSYLQGTSKTNLTAAIWDSLINTIQKDFFISKEASNVVFLNVRIAILCRKGFEIMDITEYESAFILHPIGFSLTINSFKSVTIPQLHDPRHKKLAKRCRSCLPMGMFRSSMEEFFLCYDSKNGRDTPTTRALTIFQQNSGCM